MECTYNFLGPMYTYPLSYTANKLVTSYGHHQQQYLMPWLFIKKFLLVQL